MAGRGNGGGAAAAAAAAGGGAGGGAWGAWQVQPSKFTQLVVDSMKKLYPEERADRSWDNVGLLLGNSESTIQHQRPIALVTNDLTWQVCEDAIKQGASVIAITTSDPQQATLLRLAQAGIAVYCPHTAVDAAPHGLNTWLADIVSGPHASERSVAIPCSSSSSASGSGGSGGGGGYGSLGTFAAPVPLVEILKRLAAQLGGLRHIMVATPVGGTVRDTAVRSFGVCAGSGYDVLKKADVDLLVTGETSHHSALRAIQQGRTLVQVFHSNSERGYLRTVLRAALEQELRAAVPEALVVLSEFDKDPFSIYSVDELE
ncbi:NGG1p interacting factor 3, NIF3 [Moelleriella libera RCEF 2490]|uniref:NGG1p interacting factor 3, NIF3 n=1 Tax=Moelleriella libera RCEF 2490 TaxID=1081109 RepID=A0A167Z4I0_9HYPO|nr:NGG1p interacting factor 3, NIF3 [Moelleriella libera RCEF 2490]